MIFDYKDKRWKKKREIILRRDNYLCQECKKYGKRVEATTVHHIIHAEDDPLLAWENDNLQSVCAKCHNKLHPEKGGRR